MRILPGIVIAIFVAVTIVIVQPAAAAKEYVQSVERRRAEIDDFMRSSTESPLLADDLIDFTGLNYYPVDAAVRVDVEIEQFADLVIIEVPTSADTTDRYTRYATLSFEIAGTDFTLEAWKPLRIVVSNRLFIVFADLTSGDETYGGGRYLDLYLDRNDSAIIDFNLAYNPYCVYDSAYVCPVAPLENRLSVAVRAGEKNWN